MRFAGNAIWFVFGGAITALLWLLGAAMFAVTIIGLPLSRSAIEIAKMSAFPFGKDALHIREMDGQTLNARTAVTGTIGFVVNVLWVLTFGWVLFLGHLVVGILFCITVIGIPFGLQHIKLAGISLWPVGRRVVSVELAKATRQKNAEAAVASKRLAAA